MICKAVTTSGKPCTAKAAAGSDYCVTHFKLMNLNRAVSQGSNGYRDGAGGNSLETEDSAKNAAQELTAKGNNKVNKQHGFFESKEEFSMDDKKNVSFVSGLALILSALSLLLIGIIQITATPYSETLEEVLNTKMNALETRMDVKIDTSLKKIAKAEENAALIELKNFESNLNNWLTVGANGYTDKVLAVKGPLGDLINAMEGKVKVVEAAPPAEAKGDVKKEEKKEEKKEVKEEKKEEKK